jgi:hypothetical protein
LPWTIELQLAAQENARQLDELKQHLADKAKRRWKAGLGGQGMLKVVAASPGAVSSSRTTR